MAATGIVKLQSPLLNVSSPSVTSHPPLARRVTLSGGMLPAPLNCHANNDLTVIHSSLLTSENNGTDTLASCQPKGADTLSTSEFNATILLSESQSNDGVTLSVLPPSSTDPRHISQPRGGDVPSQVNGAVALSRSSAATTSAAVSRQLT